MRKNLGINADFLGFVSRKKMPVLFASHSVFVLPSDFEAMSLAVLEAMSSECCIIASNAFGVQEQVDNFRNGFVFDKGSIEQLSNALDLVLDDSALQRKLGKNARKK